MPERPSDTRPSIFVRLARVSYMFLTLNYSAVAGVLSAITRRNVWRER
jgi:hypothetical protein